jgi:16S rRNA (guanine527-N7)-methyltransferase
VSHPDPAQWWAQLGWQPSAEQQEQFQALQVQLRQWNSRLNLTRLVEGDDFWIAQVFDSLWPLTGLIRAQQELGAQAEALRLIDVGTGGGFPGLALAIALPGARVTLVDSVQRKVEAVRAMATELGLSQRLSFGSERIETMAHQGSCRGQFDWALARAVAPAPVVAEYLVPLLKPSGQALLYRGQWSPDDQRQLAAACESLKASVASVEALELPGGRGQRHAITLKPAAPCPRQYPRAVGIPAKQPLGSSGAGQAAANPRRRR